VVQVPDYLISSPGDVDMFRFTMPAGRRATITVVREPGSQLIPVLRLFDARGRQLEKISGPQQGSYSINVSARKPVANLAFGMSRYEG
jgi:hypothetical protein